VRLAALVALVTLPMTWAVAAQVNILPNHYQGERTGANLTKTTLTAANVNASDCRWYRPFR
jgi:hypothetical protein